MENNVSLYLEIRGEELEIVAGWPGGAMQTLVGRVCQQHALICQSEVNTINRRQRRLTGKEFCQSDNCFFLNVCHDSTKSTFFSSHALLAVRVPNL